jgi:hypothetical protein
LTTKAQSVIIKSSKGKEVKQMKTNKKEVIVITSCPFCGHANEIAVNEADYWDWQDGALIQNAFPYLSAEEREMLISGACPACWDAMFSDEEDGDPDEYYDDCGYEVGYDPYMGCFTDDC